MTPFAPATLHKGTQHAHRPHPGEPGPAGGSGQGRASATGDKASAEPQQSVADSGLGTGERTSLLGFSASLL